MNKFKITKKATSLYKLVALNYYVPNMRGVRGVLMNKLNLWRKVAMLNSFTPFAKDYLYR